MVEESAVHIPAVGSWFWRALPPTASVVAFGQQEPAAAVRAFLDFVVEPLTRDGFAPAILSGNVSVPEIAVEHRDVGVRGDARRRDRDVGQVCGSDRESDCGPDHLVAEHLAETDCVAA
jgi:hypothetical protein